MHLFRKRDEKNYKNMMPGHIKRLRKTIYGVLILLNIFFFNN